MFTMMINEQEVMVKIPNQLDLALIMVEGIHESMELYAQEQIAMATPTFE